MEIIEAVGKEEACRVVEFDLITAIHKKRHAGRRKRSKDRRDKVEEVRLVTDSKNTRSELPFTFFARRSAQLTVDGLLKVKDQLGYYPFNIIEIAALSKSLEPLVIKLYPLNTNALGGRYTSKSTEEASSLPFPTMMWITCPSLHARVSHLEDLGWISIFQKHLLENPEAMQSMHNAHIAYANERWSLLSHADKVFVEENNW